MTAVVLLKVHCLACCEDVSELLFRRHHAAQTFACYDGSQFLRLGLKMMTGVMQMIPLRRFSLIILL